MLYEGAEDGLRAFILAHLPRSSSGYGGLGDCVAAGLSWAAGWRSGLRAVEQALRFQAGPPEPRQALAFHRRQTLTLCGGLGMDTMVFDPETNSSASLVGLLRVERRFRRAAGPVDGGLIHVSASLQPEVMARASRNRMEPLSAFDARAWGWLRKSWEIREHRDRKQTKEARVRKVIELRAAFGSDADGARTPLTDLARQWPSIPEDRLRSWRGWWRSPEA